MIICDFFGLIIDDTYDQVYIQILRSLLFLKGSSDAKLILKLLEHKCFLEVCVNIHPIMIKIHPVFFFLSPFLIKLFLDSCQNDIVLHRPLPR